MYGEHTLAVWIAQWLDQLDVGWLERWIAAHTLATITSVLILTYFHIVFGEMVPKSIALMHAEGTVLWITRPMLWLRNVFYPLVIGLNGLGNAILRLMGIERQFSGGHFYSPDELRYIVAESQKEGLLRAESGQILRDLFEFGELTAREVMVPRVRVTGLPLGASAREMSRILQANPHTRYPVYEENLDHIIGVVHIKDVLQLLRTGQPLRREDVYATAYVPEPTELDHVLEAMRKARTQLVVVMDEHGGTAGIVSIEDLCVEAIGEVEEGPDERGEVERDPEGRLRVLGTVRLDDVGEWLGIALEHEEVDTVSGLVLALLERPPNVGDVVTYGQVQFEVIEVENRGVREALVTFSPPPTESSEDDATSDEAT